jgi:hypothetical protein
VDLVRKPHFEQAVCLVKHQDLHHGQVEGGHLERVPTTQQPCTSKVPRVNQVGGGGVLQHMRISRMPVSSEAMLGQAFVLLVLTSIK